MGGGKGKAETKATLKAEAKIKDNVLVGGCGEGRGKGGDKGKAEGGGKGKAQ